MISCIPLFLRGSESLLRGLHRIERQRFLVLGISQGTRYQEWTAIELSWTDQPKNETIELHLLSSWSLQFGFRLYDIEDEYETDISMSWRVAKAWGFHSPASQFMATPWPLGRPPFFACCWNYSPMIWHAEIHLCPWATSLVLLTKKTLLLMVNSYEFLLSLLIKSPSIHLSGQNPSGSWFHHLKTSTNPTMIQPAPCWPEFNRPKWLKVTH